uniref:Uncharacterized protein n=1 Tax=viral metagenome TaxID=1070528 RepID=A0A6C0IHD1_9ZZZZ
MSDYETFGEDAVNGRYIKRIKFFLFNYSSKPDIIRQNLQLIKEDYDEFMSNEDENLSERERDDNFNEFIKEAMRQIEEEGLPQRNNPPYNPFNDSDFSGGKRKRKNIRHTNKRTKHKRTKHKRTKHKRSKTQRKNKRRTHKKSN